MADDLRIRLIYHGQELRQDARTLQSYNILDNSVVHCLLTSVPAAHAPAQPHAAAAQDAAAADEQRDDLELGRYCLPLFGFMLLMLWYCRIQYKQYFNAMSTLCLIAFTFLFIVMVLASRPLQRDDVHEHVD